MTDPVSEVVQKSAKGSLIIFLGQIISAVASGLMVIVIARMIGAEKYGEYTIALIPVLLFNLITDFGISAAVTRYCAMNRREGNEGRLTAVVKTGIIFSFCITLVFSVGLYIFSGWVANNYLQRPDLEQLVKVASWTVFGNGLMTTAMAAMVGYERMLLRSLTQIIYSLVRALLSVALVVIGMGSYGQVLAYTTSNLLLGIGSVAALLILFKYKPTEGFRYEFSVFKNMMTFGFPYYLKSLVISGLNQVYQTLMVLYVSTELIGNYGAAKNFGILVSFFTVTVGTVLFPIFSKYKKEDNEIRFLYHKAVKYTTIITLPVVACIILLADPITILLFGDGYSYLPLYLSLFILSYAFEGLGGTTQDYLILGIGEARVSFIAGVITFLVGATLSIAIIPFHGVIGLLLVSLIAPRVGWIYSTLWLKKNIGFSADYMSSLKIYGSAIIAFLFSFLIVSVVQINELLELIMGGSVFILFYIIALPISGALDKGALKELGKVGSYLGPLSPFLQRMLILLSNFAR